MVQPEMVLYEYQNREVIEVQSLLFSSTNIHQYYCDGAKLALEDPEKFAAFKKDRKFITMLYGTNLWN